MATVRLIYNRKFM